MKKTLEYVLLIVIVIVGVICVFTFTERPKNANAAVRYESLSVGGTAAGWSTSSYSSGIWLAKKASCTTETAQMRFRVDGTAPTASTGHVIETGQVLNLDNTNDITNFKIIRTTATSGTINCSFE